MPQGWAALAQLRLIGGSGQGPPSTPLKPPPELAGIHWGLLGAQGLIQGLLQHAARLPRCSLFLGRVLGFCWAFLGSVSAGLLCSFGVSVGWPCWALAVFSSFWWWYGIAVGAPALFGSSTGLLLAPLCSLEPMQHFCKAALLAPLWG